ncbi:hypothetical protein [Nocardioides marmoraquaticus]
MPGDDPGDGTIVDVNPKLRRLVIPVALGLLILIVVVAALV